jgi:hypothetical protein
MRWPAKLIARFDEALQDVTLAEGYDKNGAIVAFLDGAARRAVWRCQGRAEDLVAAYFSPYTPIGAMTADGLGGGFVVFTLRGDVWGTALDALRTFVRENARLIVEDYEASALPYDDRCG